MIPERSVRVCDGGEKCEKLKKLLNGKRISIPNVPIGKRQWDEPKKRLPFTSQPEFSGIYGK